MTASPAIRIEALSVSRGDKRVLQDVSLEIRAGEVTALVGRNGAGKSTLVMTVCGMLFPSSGSITLGGASLAGLKPDAIRRLGVATVLEGQRILSGLSVLDNPRAAGSMLSRPDLEAGVDRTLALFPELRERLAVAGRLMRCLAKELAPRRIRVNTIHPGPIDNPFQLAVERGLGEAIGGDGTAFFNSMIPLGRHGRPDEIARSVLYLASDQSSFTTGSTLMVDGGMAT